MGWMTRFEPATSGSTDRRSNQLSYIHHKSSIVIILIFGRFCQKNFPPRFCKPGQTNKQPPYKICRRRAQKSGRGTQFQALTHPPPGTPQTHQFHRARVPQGRAMQTPPGVAPLFSRGRRLRGGQMAQALAHLVLCQHPLFRRPQAHL